MSSEGSPKFLNNPKIFRATGTESVYQPTLRYHHDDPLSTGGAEHQVYSANLEYENDERVGGLVFKRFSNVVHEYVTDKHEAKVRLDDVLAQWQKLREIRRELEHNHKRGFDLPSTVRGVLAENGGGLLISDMTMGGSNEVIDAKLLRGHARNWSPKEWKMIKKAILRDIELAYTHNIKLVSGNGGLDPWLVVRDKKTRKLRVVISDIGLYTSTTLDPTLRYDTEVNDPEFLRKKGLTALERLENDLMVAWGKKKREPFFSERK